MLRKITLIAFGALIAPSLALAAVNLKKVTIVDGSQIELLFDAKVDPGQVKTEFVRDNIQLSLANTSVYPAKVSMVSGSDLTKVFAYQYSPALVRARFTVKGDAAEYANRLQVKISGKTITVKIAEKIASGRGDQVAATASSALRAATAPAPSEAEAKAAQEKLEEETRAAREKEKKALLERVAADKAEKSDKAETTEKSANLTGKKTAKKEPIAGGKSLPSPMRSIGVMLFVLGVFGLFVMFLKRLKGGEGKSAKAPKGALGGFLKQLSGGAGGKGMIEVVATHHLAPKRSIVVVRIQDRMLVLGMTNDAVNLITEFKAGEDGEADESIGLGDFAASLKKFEDAAEAPTPRSAPAVKASEPKLSGSNAAKANLGDIAAAALGLAKPKPASAPKASAAANAYQTSQSKQPAAGATAAGGPNFSPALEAALREPSVKPSIRAQIKDRVQGMKPL